MTLRPRVRVRHLETGPGIERDRRPPPCPRHGDATGNGTDSRQSTWLSHTSRLTTRSNPAENPTPVKRRAAALFLLPRSLGLDAMSEYPRGGQRDQPACNVPRSTHHRSTMLPEATGGYRRPPEAVPGRGRPLRRRHVQTRLQEACHPPGRRSLTAQSWPAPNA